MHEKMKTKNKIRTEEEKEVQQIILFGIILNNILKNCPLIH